MIMKLNYILDTYDRLYSHWLQNEDPNDYFEKAMELRKQAVEIMTELEKYADQL